MGLISAGLNALGGTLASQWKEYFYCDSMPANVLATKAMTSTAGSLLIARRLRASAPSAAIHLMRTI